MNRYKNIPLFINQNNKRYYAQSKYPEVPLSDDDIYVITTVGDRLDILAQQFYGDSSLWWVISSANNNLSQNSLFIPEGTQLRIPIDPSNIELTFNSLNQNV
jgi:phage tail protein X